MGLDDRNGDNTSNYDNLDDILRGLHNNPHRYIDGANRHLNSITSLIRPGVYVLVHKNKKKIHINQSTCILESILRLYKQIEDGSHPVKALIDDKKELGLYILDEEENLTKRQIKLITWLKKFNELGYREYVFIRHARHSLKLRITEDFKVEVRLVNSRNDYYKLKEFNDMTEATEFIKLHESNLLALVESNEMTQTLK